MARVIVFPNIDNIIKDYLSGVSVNKLAQQEGVSRNVIDRVLKKHGVKLRSQSEAESMKWSFMSEQQRKRQVQKAHQATKGRFISTSEKIKRAKSAYNTAHKTGLYEKKLCKIISQIGYTPQIQKNFGIYNLDIGIKELPIAIEIQSNGHSKLTNRKNLNRAKYICSRENFLLYIIIKQREEPCFKSLRNYLISFFEQISGDKTFLGKYGMISSNGEPFSSPRYNFNGLTRII